MDVANNADTTDCPRLGGITGKGFMPGQSGNPSGRPKKKPITELYERIMNDPELVGLMEDAVIKSILKGGMAGVMHFREAADRLEGKVTQPIDAAVTMNLAEAIAEARKRAGK